ncbi:MAG: hypothetical protein PHX43_09190 [Alphaproteobacteria bacterium]|nr:hypothetical protein [Alphaproteobacteria bacterium]
MTNKKPKRKSRSEMIGVRVDAEQKKLIDAAAEREGLQISSFIIMILVRVRILPDCCLKKLKRRPVPFFNELHGLLGTANLIGGNCKQLAVALPDVVGLRAARASINRAASAITDSLQGRAIPASVNLYKLDGALTDAGYNLNDIVRSVNMGKPELSELRATLAGIARAAEAITAALTGRQIQNTDVAYVKDLAKLAMEEMFFASKGDV